jgi:hypothetical protein
MPREPGVRGRAGRRVALVTAGALLPSLFGLDSDVLVSRRARFLACAFTAECAAGAQNVDQSIAAVEAMILYKPSIEKSLRTVAGAGSRRWWSH